MTVASPSRSILTRSAYLRSVAACDVDGLRGRSTSAGRLSFNLADAPVPAAGDFAAAAQPVDRWPRPRDPLVSGWGFGCGSPGRLDRRSGTDSGQLPADRSEEVDQGAQKLC